MGGKTILRILRWLRRKGKKRTAEEKKSSEETETAEPDLKKICMDDPEAYEALYDTMFLTPEMIGKSSEEAAGEAEKREEKGDIVGAAAYYKMAGGLAIYEGDVEKVKRYFGRYAELTGRSMKILEIPERAVEKAREYYRAREATHQKA